jgi:hypothetical protein
MWLLLASAFAAPQEIVVGGGLSYTVDLPDDWVHNSTTAGGETCWRAPEIGEASVCVKVDNLHETAEELFAGQTSGVTCDKSADFTATDPVSGDHSIGRDCGFLTPAGPRARVWRAVTFSGPRAQVWISGEINAAGKGYEAILTAVIASIVVTR